MTLVNLCPHPIVIEGKRPCTLPAAEFPARLLSSEKLVTEVEGIPVIAVSLGGTMNLPDPRLGVLLIVSSVLRSAFPHRSDLVSPARLFRDETGTISCCRALAVNPSSGIYLESKHE